MQMSGWPPATRTRPIVWGSSQGQKWNTGIQAVPSQPGEDPAIIWGFCGEAVGRQWVGASPSPSAQWVPMELLSS